MRNPYSSGHPLKSNTDASLVGEEDFLDFDARTGLTIRPLAQDS